MVEFKQQDIFEASNIKNKKAHSNKSNDASFSIFGWGFQIMASLMYSFENIEFLDYIVVEGKTQDIEIYFTNSNKPLYIQAKSKQTIKKITECDDKKCIEALESLLKTTIKVKNEYSKLVYVSNLPNPLNLNEMEMNISWKPSIGTIYTKSYSQLLDKGQNFLNGKFLRAKINVGKKQNNDSTYFDISKLCIATIIYGNKTEDDNIKFIKEKIESLTNGIGYRVNSNTILNISNSLFNFYFNKAEISSKNIPQKNISKTDLVWKIIVKLINEKQLDWFLDINEAPLNIVEKLEDLKGRFIKEASQDLNNINQILQDFYKNKVDNNAISEIKKFINNKWNKYKDDVFPSDDKQFQEYATKEIMWEILMNHQTISYITSKTKC